MVGNEHEDWIAKRSKIPVGLPPATAIEYAQANMIIKIKE